MKVIPNKNLVIVFTLGVSLLKWQQQGIITRELEIYKRYKKDGWKITFITYGNSEDKAIIKNYFNSEYYVVPLRDDSYFGNIGKNNQYINLIYSFKAIILLFKKKDQINIIKSAQLYGCWVCAIFSFLTKKPWLSRTGYDFFKFLPFEISNKNHFIKSLKIKFLKIIHLFFAKIANVMIVSSEEDFLNSKKWFKGELIINKNWIYIPKIMNNDFKSKIKNFKTKEIKKLIIVGRLENQKRIDIAIDALNKSKNSFYLDIYGKGSKKSFLEKKLKEDTPSKIKFMGSCENKKLLKKMISYHVLISTSEIEGTPKVILEAMASGLIVVARNCAGNRELIKNNQNGFLFNNSSELLQILEDLNSLTEIKIENILKINYFKILNEHCLEKFSKLEISVANQLLNYNK